MYSKVNSPTSRYAINRGLLGGQPQLASTPRPIWMDRPDEDVARPSEPMILDLFVRKPAYLAIYSRHYVDQRCSRSFVPQFSKGGPAGRKCQPYLAIERAAPAGGAWRDTTATNGALPHANSVQRRIDAFPASVGTD
jgi:hypothetical protein